MDNDLEMLHLLALEEEEDMAEDEDQIYRAALTGALIYLGAAESRKRRGARRQRLYLVRNELLPNPRVGTPWQRLLDSRSDPAYITTMGIDVTTFTYILDSGFTEHWNATPIPRADCPGTAVPRLNSRSLDAAGALGLILHYLNSTMREVSLMQIFALIPSTVSRYITFTLTILLSVLRVIPESEVRWLIGDEFQSNNDLIIVRHNLLTGAFGSMDGLNLAVQTSTNQEIENATFNGWLHDHFVSSVLAFGASGVIIACKLNAPGSWHDSRVARPIYEKLRAETPEGYYLVTDTAFPRGTDQIKGRIKAPMKDGTRLPADPVARKAAMAFDRQLLSYRQTAEWGMRAVQGSFGRLRVPLEINFEARRGDLLETVVRLYQIRTRLVGINQIRSVYMPIWRENEQEQLWSHFEDILFRDQRKMDRVSRFHCIEEDT
ncbi:uncharacterized protein LACBIDRAFT_316314 [Laccaria bicolor S238N-H82]|uniref:Predicted protein n=1 Tax=Laccaria bicolor (strain S238N-H82 / ATCC MYA-4686) TaxID=486041 RepID=B0E558_LACBS|nr:uncharacterized protein LACBIDRAFT_316314 [Laccaria bicolor S238N-H82]EDQ98024.1 predicted protein [Laccaria bicolor S238N-H82]|eukprot:XP_001891326.1 predicted protein [Laccaria bicolor S238N-H82]